MLRDACGGKDRQKEPRTVPPARISLSRRVHHGEPIHVEENAQPQHDLFSGAAKASCESPIDLSRKPASQYER